MSARWTQGALTAGLLLPVLLSPLHPVPLRAGPAAETAERRSAAAGDLYVAGPVVEITSRVAGDVVASGGRVAIRQEVGGDVAAAGGLVAVAGPVADDVRVAGGEVAVSAPVAGDLLAAGGYVALGPEARVGGAAWLAGGSVEVDGTVARELRAAGGRVRVAGRVMGDARLAAREIEVGPGAVITGDLVYWSPAPARIRPGARIGGTVTHHRVGAPGPAAATGRRIAALSGFLSLLGLTLAGTVLYLLFPGFTIEAARTIGTDPWRSLAAGFALLVAAPAAVLLLAATLVGIPVALAVLALYPVALLLGFLTAAFFLGDAAAALVRRDRALPAWLRLLSLLGALVVLALVRLVPVVGGLLLFLALLVGLGALGLRAYRAWAYAGARPPAPAA